MGRQSLVAAIGAVLVATSVAALYYLTRPPPARAKAKKSAKAATSDVPEKAEELSIDRTKLLGIFHEITGRMQHVVMRLAEEEQRVAQQGATSGQAPSAAEIQRYLIARFEEAMREIENQVYSKYKTNEEAVRVSAKFYENDEELVKAISTLKALYNAVMGHSKDLPEVPDHLTMDKLLQVLEGTMSVLRSSAQKVRDELLQEGVDMQADAQGFSAKFQPRYAKAVEVARTGLLTQHGIEQETILQAAVVKYQNNPQFQVELKKLTEVHNAKMAAMGFGAAS